MQVELLGEGCYRSTLGPSPDGQDGSSHYALVEFADGVERRVFVKLYPDQLKILNELTGHILAAAAGHAVPEKAAVVYVPVERLPDPCPKWVHERAPQPTPAWCSTVIPNDSLKIFYNANIKPIRTELADSEKAPSIVAFDDWLANIDRNVGNLLRIGKGDYALIDHGCILNDERWTEAQPDVTATYRNKIRDILGQVADTLPFKNSAYDAASAHHPALRRAWPGLDRWWSILDDSSRARIEAFLDRRSQDADALKRRLGLLT